MISPDNSHFECMVCFEDNLSIEKLKKCKNEKCTFLMCNECSNNLNKQRCPQCNQPTGRIIDYYNPLDDEPTMWEVSCESAKGICIVGTVLQLPFVLTGAVISFFAGQPFVYAFLYANMPCTLLYCCEMRKCSEDTRARRANNILRRRLMNLNGITAVNPLLPSHVAPVAQVIDNG